MRRSHRFDSVEDDGAMAVGKLFNRADVPPPSDSGIKVGILVNGLQRGLLWAMAVCLVSGCSGARLRPAPELPSESEVRRERIVVHSAFEIPQHHRLLDELVLLHERVTRTLALPESKETVHVYLFESAARYRSFVSAKLPDAPERRACFVHTKEDLRVYAHWSDLIAVDLRHEVTHGYLHGIVSDIPLWLDEGIAEYFEVDADSRGFNLPHRRLLQHRRVEDNWRPNLKQLEKLEQASEMGQMDYAESWGWVHYLLESTDENRQLLQDYLARLRMSGEAPPLSERLTELVEDPELMLLKHLRTLQPAN